MKHLAASALLFCAMLAGCKTTDVVEPPLAPLTEDAFVAQLKAAKADTNPFSGEQKLTELIEYPAITPDQHARALYARATQRWKKTHDKPGAQSDFREYIEKYPSGTFTTNAGYEVLYVEAEMAAAESRLLTLQTLRAWFDDTWALGKRDEAANRYRRSGLTPEPHQLYQLRATGYVCQGAGNSKLHNYGPLTSEIQDLYWCK